MDHQLLGSPPNISSADMSVMAVPGYTDCAQQAMNYAPNSRSRFMDTVCMIQGGIPYSPTATSSVNYHHNSPIPSYSPSMMSLQPQPQQQQQQQQSQPSQPQPQPNSQQNPPRVLGSHTPAPSLPCVVAGGQMVGVAGPAGYATHCSLAKLQQLTNGIMEIVPENQITPPPNLTTPPPVTMTPPPGLMRSMTTPPVVSLHQQMGHAALMGGVSCGSSSGSKYQQRQRPSSTATSNTVRKSPSVTPNVTVNPNMTFTPNVTIQPGTLQRYPMNTVNMFNGYRMQQSMVNPGYLTAANAGFLTQLQSAQQMPMQMGMMNMNVHPQQFPQQMQQHPSQPNVYPSHYGYNIMNMNMNMRR